MARPKKEEVKPPRIARAELEEIMAERYASEAWLKIFVEEPRRRSQLLDLCRIERQVEKVADRLEQLEERGDDDCLAETDGGNPCIQPLVRLLEGLRSSRLAAERSLKELMERAKAKEKSGDFGFMRKPGAHSEPAKAPAPKSASRPAAATADDGEGEWEGYSKSRIKLEDEDDDG